MKQLSQKRADQRLAKELKKERKKANKAQTNMVQDRKTGEWYDPETKLEELCNSQEFLDVIATTEKSMI